MADRAERGRIHGQRRLARDTLTASIARRGHDRRVVT